MHYNFSINSKKLSILAVGAVFLLVLVYAAGWFSGILWSGSVGTSRKTALQPSYPAATAMAPKPSLPHNAPAAAPPAKAPASPVPAPAAVASAPPATGSATAPAPLPKPPVNPPAAKRKPASPPPIKKASVQVGAYRMKTNALAMVKKMAKKGYSPYIFQARDISNRLWYTVRIGAFASMTEAKQAAARFKKKEGTDAVVVGFRSLAPIGKKK